MITSSQLSEELERLNVAIVDSNPRLQNGGTADSSTDGYADDIEAEANSYFHQMFSGNLTIDAMVQMLARFKESPVKRCNFSQLERFISCPFDILYGCNFCSLEILKSFLNITIILFHL